MLLENMPVVDGEEESVTEVTLPRLPAETSEMVDDNGFELKKIMSSISADLRALQRQRSIVLKSKLMQANRLQAIVAGTLGYSSGMAEKERQAKFREATAVIKGILDGTAEHPLASIVKVSHVGIEAFDDMKSELEKAMLATVKRLPTSIIEWVQHPEQRGFGLLFLAIVIGETGDLNNYAKVSRLWRRLGCAPWTFDGKTAMGSTWRFGKEGKLPASEWERFGYSPRRRSIAFLVGEGLCKANYIRATGDDGPYNAGDGPYRVCYGLAKAAAKMRHPDWQPMRCHKHGMLLATKLLLENLWKTWRTA